MAASRQWLSVGLMAIAISAILFAGSADARVCAPGYMDCDMDGRSCEVYVNGDINNCGYCGVNCTRPSFPAWLTACINGTCTYGTRCGRISCVNRPGFNSTCINGKCIYTCSKEGYANCNNNTQDGCETYIKGDINNCGKCGVKCEQSPYFNTTCVNGTCIYDCVKKGYADCNNNTQDGCETYIKGDINNCGKCGVKCEQSPYFNTTCVNGTCIYDCVKKGYADCNGNWRDGCETNILEDTNNCGRCGVVCKPSYWNTYSLCFRSQCAYKCRPGWSHCNEKKFPPQFPILILGRNYCRYDLNDDVNNCGACFNKCKPCKNGSPKCNEGKCQCICDKGFANCNGSWDDGCETNISTDVANCGGCGKPCGGNEKVVQCWNGLCYLPVEE